MKVDSNGGDNPSVNEGEQVEEPNKGMCFSSREDMYTFYATYAKHVGFSIAHRAQHFGDDGELKNFAIECSRAGERKKKSEVNPHLCPQKLVAKQGYEVLYKRMGHIC